MKREAVILFSGGTDSTAATAIAAGLYDQLHLLTFFEDSTAKSPIPTENIERLRAAFPNVVFTHSVISTERLVRWLSYGHSPWDYLKHLFRDHVYNLATPGFSSLSWHLAALRFATQLRQKGHNVLAVHDGMTRELTHLPGHMPLFREFIAELYKKQGFDFSSPVYDFAVPPDQRFVDRMVVDRHGFTLNEELIPAQRTTGVYLYERGILPHPNVKGSLFDLRMQHDCYPFVVYNILVFWLLMPVRSWSNIESRVVETMKSRLKMCDFLFRNWNHPLFEDPL